MTTNLYAVAGPSKPASIATTNTPSPKSGSESPSPLNSIRNLPPTTTELMDASGSGSGSGSGTGSGGGVQKPGLSLEQNGEVLKVPAFLNKLYTMVSDNTVNDLIYWGEDGDSFYVPNAEHFGRELLPRWFKHSNFSSFVRQLNMYGFHKVPHLQSGALKNETPAELWEFANPFFKRDQPKLLAKVTRKNNRPGNLPPAAPSTGSSSSNTRSAAQTGTAAGSSSSIGPPTQGKYLITDGTVEGEAGQLIGTSSQLVDLNAIHSGIAAIRQTQATIGADLRKLQASNEALWRQAYETQEKSRKHEETINLIVSFLERLFGTEGSGLKGLKEAMRRGGVGRQREDAGTEEAGLSGGTGSAKKRKRMGIDRMISDGKSKDDVDFDLDMDDDDRLVEIGSKIGYPMPSFKRSESGSTPDPWSLSAPRFTTLPTDDEATTPTSRAASKTATPTPGTEQTLGTNHLSPLSDTDHLLPSDKNALARYNAHNYLTPDYSFDPLNPNSNANASQSRGNQNQNQGHSQPLLSPTSAEAAASAFNLDPSLLQTTIGSLLQSPAAAQMFLNSLNSTAQGQALQSPGLRTPSHLQNQQNFFAPNPTPNFNLNSNSTYNPTPNANVDVKPNINANQTQSQSQNSGGNLNGNPQLDINVNGDYLDPTLALFSPLPNSQNQNQSQEALASSTDALLRSYQDAVGVNGSVDQLQESIDSLVRSMGLDIPGNGNINGNVGVAGDGTGTGVGMGIGNGGEQLVDPDFNVDEFLEHLAKGGEEGLQGDMTAGGEGGTA